MRLPRLRPGLEVAAFEVDDDAAHTIERVVFDPATSHAHLLEGIAALVYDVAANGDAGADNVDALIDDLVVALGIERSAAERLIVDAVDALVAAGLCVSA